MIIVKRTKSLRLGEYRARRVMRLWEEGADTYDIAKCLAVSEATVYNTLNEVHRDGRKTLKGGLEQTQESHGRDERHALKRHAGGEIRRALEDWATRRSAAYRREQENKA